jgi:hypothetical protein
MIPVLLRRDEGDAGGEDVFEDDTSTGPDETEAEADAEANIAAEAVFNGEAGKEDEEVGMASVARDATAIDGRCCR